MFHLTALLDTHLVPVISLLWTSDVGAVMGSLHEQMLYCISTHGTLFGLLAIGRVEKY